MTLVVAFSVAIQNRALMCMDYLRGYKESTTEYPRNILEP
jgi:hypothetical protein